MRCGTEEEDVVVNKRVMAVLVCTLLALIAASVWVPVAHGSNLITVVNATARNQDRIRVREWESYTGQYVDRWCFAWSRTQAPPPTRPYIVCPPGAEPLDGERVRWPVVFIEQTLILLIGGGLLTWVVRRERRRRAAA